MTGDGDEVVVPRYLDTAGVAERLGVKRATVLTWAHRGLLPPPDITLGQSSGWLQSTVDDWATLTGRTRPPEAPTSPI